MATVKVVVGSALVLLLSSADAGGAKSEFARFAIIAGTYIIEPGVFGYVELAGIVNDSGLSPAVTQARLRLNGTGEEETMDDKTFQSNFSRLGFNNNHVHTPVVPPSAESSVKPSDLDNSSCTLKGVSCSKFDFGYWFGLFISLLCLFTSLLCLFICLFFLFFLFVLFFLFCIISLVIKADINIIRPRVGISRGILFLLLLTTVTFFIYMEEGRNHHGACIIHCPSSVNVSSRTIGKTVATLDHCHETYYINHENHFSLKIPKRTCKAIALLLRVCWFGPFKFQEGQKSVSPVFYICDCDHKNFQFIKPLTVPTSHVLHLEFCIAAVLPKSSIPVGKKTHGYFFITSHNGEDLETYLAEALKQIKVVEYMFTINTFQFNADSEDEPALEMFITQPSNGIIGKYGSSKV